LDQIRAQKAFEKAELENRAIEAAKKAKYDAELVKLHEARQKQFADNDARLKMETDKNRELFLKVVQK